MLREDEMMMVGKNGRKRCLATFDASFPHFPLYAAFCH